MEFDKPIRLNACKLALGFTNIHVERRMGSQDQAIRYCQDPGKRVPGTEFLEQGTKAKSGKRTDLDDIKNRIDNGESMRDVAENHFADYVRYHKGFEKYKSIRKEPAPRETTVEVYWGPTGTGKTFKAFTENPGAYWMLPVNSQNIFFDGYDGQECIVIDEFYGWIPYNLMLRICDIFPLNVNTKGAAVTLQCKKVVITSNSAPVEWYKSITPAQFAALSRRLTKVEEMAVPFTGERFMGALQGGRISKRNYPPNINTRHYTRDRYGQDLEEIEISDDDDDFM